MGRVGVAEVGGRCPAGSASDIYRVYFLSRPRDREKDTTQDATPTLRPGGATRQKFKKIRIRQSDRAAPSGAPPHPSRPAPGRASAAAHLPAPRPRPSIEMRTLLCSALRRRGHTRGLARALAARARMLGEYSHEHLHRARHRHAAQRARLARISRPHAQRAPWTSTLHATTQGRHTRCEG